jgi:carbon-monoxide dehydrogenase small subunit
LSTHLIQIRVNGDAHQLQVPSRRLLCDFIRDDLNLTGTKRGCETGTCGACSVLLDGEVVKSCLSLAVQASGSDITTIEALGSSDNLHPLQQCFMDIGGLQCGYCTPGFLITACAMLKKNPHPTEDEVRTGLSGNLCRCTGYTQIVESIMAAAEQMHGN